MSEVKLNLARKWRSKNFEEIIGQDLSVRMLKNSLYLQQYFPVYLFSGQRGCGKTTTARVFAAALNCEQLQLFQKEPQRSAMPCLCCASCVAMGQGKHPDFIEIDAASHTGVDHVRMLIDSASLLPVMGQKKIYLIDEAHMLSKAAFNALLKILEEPPPSVIFILATTDSQKIIDTVQSRCFQLFFRPVDMEILQTRLQMVCDQEQIVYEDAGLALIVKQADGSVRDAINLLEQVRFSSKAVTHDAVLSVLGYMDDQALISLFKVVISGTPQQILSSISDLKWERYSAQIIWVRLLELVRAALWIRHGVTPASFVEYYDVLKKIVHVCSAKQLTLFLQIMYDQELLFVKTTSNHDFLEMILLQICQRLNPSGSDDGTPSSACPAAPVVEQDEFEDDDEMDDGDDDDTDDDEDDQDETLQSKWKQFTAEIGTLQDPLINSIFSQGVIKSFDENTGNIAVEFSKEFVFFADWLAETKSVWLSVMQNIFGQSVVFNPLFTGQSMPIKKQPARTVTPSISQSSSQFKIQTSGNAPRVNTSRAYGAKSFEKRNRSRGVLPFASGVSIDISDTQLWQKTHMILQYLPGSVTELRE